MGSDFARSPAIVKSPVCTGPHVKPLRNGRHSATGLPLAPICCVSETVRAEDKILNPGDPVSTRMPPIVWQFVVLPGAQTVTLVKAPLMNGAFVGGPAAGPALTVIACTFEADPP